MSKKEKLSRFGEDLHRRLTGRGWSRDYLAAQLGCSYRSVGRWMRGETTPNADYVQSLKRLVGYTEEQVVDLLSARGTDPQLYNFAHAAITLGGWDVLERTILDILDEFPLPPIIENEMGSPEKWMQVYKMTPDTGRVLIDSKGQVLGYWLFIAVTDHIYEDIIAGKNVNSTISAKDVDPMSFPGLYDVYFVDLFMPLRHNRPSHKRLLRGALFGCIKELADEGMFIRRISAHLSSTEIEVVCKGLGFVERATHLEHKTFGPGGPDDEYVSSKIYELVLNPTVNSGFFRRDEDLRTLYLEGWAEGQ